MVTNVTVFAYNCTLDDVCECPNSCSGSDLRTLVNQGVWVNKYARTGLVHSNDKITSELDSFNIVKEHRVASKQHLPLSKITYAMAKRIVASTPKNASQKIGKM